MADATFWTLEQVAAAVGRDSGSAASVPVSPGAARGAAVSGISIDTRTLRKGQVYVALRGENHDGHDFVEAAFEAGAAAAIVEAGNPKSDIRNPKFEGRSLIRVADTLEALQQLASAYREHLAGRGCRVIAVAGSNGKTTTRHMIHAVLSRRHRGTQSPKSFNNHIGVPLTILGAGENDDFTVVEIGTNHPGEVAALARIARPDAAVITSIGHEHMEHFVTLDNVAKEEFSIFDHLVPGGLAVVPVSEADRLKKGDFEVVTFEEDPAVPAGDAFPLPGVHHRRSAAAAAAVGRWMQVPDAAITEALRGVTPVPGRLEMLEMGRINVIHDAYNANPDSMRAALDILAARKKSLTEPGAATVAVLGDMFELGDAAPDLHRQIGRHILELNAGNGSGDTSGGGSGGTSGGTSGGGIDRVITIGRLAMFIAEALLKPAPAGTPVPAVHPFVQWADDLPAQVAALLNPGDIVLLKASRGMRFERLLPAIEARSQESGVRNQESGDRRTE